MDDESIDVITDNISILSFILISTPSIEDEVKSTFKILVGSFLNIPTLSLSDISLLASISLNKLIYDTLSSTDINVSLYVLDVKIVLLTLSDNDINDVNISLLVILEIKFFKFNFSSSVKLLDNIILEILDDDKSKVIIFLVKRVILSVERSSVTVPITSSILS